jgi:hypothetical protein
VRPCVCASREPRHGSRCPLFLLCSRLPCVGRRTLRRSSSRWHLLRRRRATRRRSNRGGWSVCRTRSWPNSRASSCIAAHRLTDSEVYAFTMLNLAARTLNCSSLPGTDGTCVVECTVGADKRTCLAFLGYLKAEHEIEPGLGVFAKAELSSWTEAWLRALEAKQLRYSTMANCALLLSTPIVRVSP